jgi:hypothetical protein
MAPDRECKPSTSLRLETAFSRAGPQYAPRNQRLGESLQCNRAHTAVLKQCSSESLCSGANEQRARTCDRLEAGSQIGRLSHDIVLGTTPSEAPKRKKSPRHSRTRSASRSRRCDAAEGRELGRLVRITAMRRQIKTPRRPGPWHQFQKG